MRVLVTGSSGHLGEALVRVLRDEGHEVLGVDLLPSAFTSAVGSIVDRPFVKSCVAGCDAVLHAATLHKPHVATHAAQDFVDTNVTGTLNLLEEAGSAGVRAFVFTSTTSTFGDALTPAGGEPAAWITEDVVPRPRNIYGVTKLAAENLCELFHRKYGLPTIMLRTSRFFLEKDDRREIREAFDDDNAKVNEYLFRRVDLADVVAAHLAAMSQAQRVGFGRYIVSATSPFAQDDLAELRVNAPAVVRRRVDGFEPEYARRGWRMFPSVDRVYVNQRIRRELDWRPNYDFPSVLESLRSNRDYRSPLAVAVGSKGYHSRSFADGPYPA